MIFWAKLEKRTYKKNQYKDQLVQNRLKGTKIWLEIDQIGLNETKVDLIGPNGIEVDLIGPNSNCLIFTEKKNLQQILENKLYIILQLQNNYLFPRITWVCN